MRFHKQNIKTALATTFVLGAIAAPAASAHRGQVGWVVRPDPDQQAAQLAQTAAARETTSSWVVRPNPDQQTPLPAAPTIVRVTERSGGVDWGDAGIGAAGALGLIFAATGGGLLLARRRSNAHTRTGVRTTS